ncbi:MAG: hypothetical protein WEA34_13260 [Gemmatimonadota bacterium]
MSDWKADLRSLISGSGEVPRTGSEGEPPGIRRYLTRVAAPALEAVAAEFQELGRDVEVDEDERYASITVLHDDAEEFFFEVRVKPYGADGFAFPTVPLRDPQGKTYRAEAHLRDRALERDVTGADQEELIRVFLEEYRRHLEWHG